MSELRRKAVRNAFFSGLQLPVNLVVGLLVPPVVLGFVGVEGYGTWVLALAVSGLLVLADAGVSQALAKYVAEYSARREERPLCAVISVATLCCAGGSLVVLALLGSARGWAIRYLFGEQAVVGADLDRIVLVMLVVHAVGVIGNVPMQVLVGLQRLDLSNTVGICRMVANAAMTVGFLASGWRLHGLLAAWALSSVGASVASALMARRLLPSFRPSLEGWQEHLPRLLRLGSAAFVTTTAVNLVGRVERIVLAYFAGIGAVAFYDLAGAFVGQVRALPSVILPPFMPLAAELHALRDRTRLSVLFERGLKYLNLIAILPFGFAVVFAPAIVRVWLGDGYPLIATSIQILALSAYVNLLTGPPGSMMFGMGQAWLAIHSCGLLAGISVTLTPLLASAYGYYGVVVGSAAACVLASLYTLIRFPLAYGFSITRTVVDGILKVGALSSLVLAGAAALYGFLSPAGRVQEGAALLVTGGLSLAVFGGFLWRTRLVGGEEAELVRIPIQTILGVLHAGWRGGR